MASTDPAPGAGSSAAVAAALGAALLEMVAGIELARDTPPAAVPTDAPERARGLRAQALELADRDLSSYVPVLEALRSPKEDPERGARLREALAAASGTPLAVAEAAAETAELAAKVTAATPAAVRGDALAGVLIAEAAAVAAASLVEINLAGGDTPDPDLARARDARRRAQEAREDALATLPRG